MVRKQCNATTHSHGQVYVCTKGENHIGAHHAYDAETNIEFYRDEQVSS